MRTKGKISSWNDEKGYGFISPIGGGERVFIHIKAFINNNRRPEVNQVVTYALSTDKRGRPRAVKATLAGDRLPQKAKKPNETLPIISSIVFLTLVAATVISSKVPPLIFTLYLAASLLTFVVYALDKTAARKGTWRISENTLHTLALFGGWPGAIVAQQKLRHKSKKQSFRTVFWLTVLINCGAFAWALTPDGAIILQSLLGAVA
jgi:uncharacterized membrane protein YsdA (DUF1294 family)/cold shock CspA family protein